MLFLLFLPYPLGFCIFSFYEWQFRESHSLFKGLIKCLCEAEGSGGQFVLPFPDRRGRHRDVRPRSSQRVAGENVNIVIQTHARARAHLFPFLL